MKRTRPLNFESVLSQGWAAWTLLLLLMIALMMQQGGFVGPDGAGSRALTVLAVLGTLQVFMSVLLQVLDSTWFRWANAGLVVLVTLIFAIHHVLQHSGLALGGVCSAAAEGVFHVVEAAHHALGILMCVLAVRWARQGTDVSAATSLHLART